MPTTTRLALPYPALSDTPDVPRDMQALADATDAAITGLVRPPTGTAPTGLKVVYGFLSAQTIGAVAAGGAYTWYVTIPALTTIVHAVATFKHQSLTQAGWLPPESLANAGRLQVNVTVAWNTNVDPDQLHLTAYFPTTFTVDNRGEEGITYVAFGV